MSPIAFAWKSLVRQPARAALGILGIAAVGALLFDMLMLSRGLVVSFEDLLNTIGYDVRATASSSLVSFGRQIPEASEVTALIAGLDEVEDVIALRFGDAFAFKEERGWDVELLGSRSRARRNWTLLEGEPLSEQTADGVPLILLNPSLADKMHASVGEIVTLRSGTLPLPPVEFRVAGIAEFPWDTLTQRTAVVTLAEFARVFGEGEEGDVADLLLIASRPEHGASAVVEAVRGIGLDLHVYSNEHLVQRFRTRDFSYFRQISFVLSSITSFFGFLLVATLLTVSVNQRFAEIAALRALGFTRRRIVADLLCESALFVGTGGLLAVPLGHLLAALLESILRSIPGIPGRLEFFVLEPRSAVLYVALLTGTGILAALYPIYLAVRLPIAATLRKEVVS
jgi:putative ABC transport system permease protein